MNSLIFNYVRSFTTSYSGTHVYEYPSLSIVNKSGLTWQIQIRNTSSMGINLSYNSKMCFLSDAKNWTGLKDISTIYLAPYMSKTVSISENWFATSITCSYIYEDYRVITYADSLSTNGTLSIYNNLITKQQLPT